MATINSAASGDWNTGSTWVGGIVPTSVDAVNINNGHTVTLGATADFSTLNIKAGGIFTKAPTGNIIINAQHNLTVESGTSVFNFDVSDNTQTFTLNLNCSSHADGRGLWATAGSTTIKGKPKARWTKLASTVAAGATSCDVLDATGHEIGDTIIFATTDDWTVTPHTDRVTLTGVLGNTLSWSGGLSYTHLATGSVGNFTSNAVVRPLVANTRNYVRMFRGATTLDNVQFLYLKDSSTYAQAGLSIYQPALGTDITITNSAILDSYSYSMYIVQGNPAGIAYINNNVFYTILSNSAHLFSEQNYSLPKFTGNIGCVFATLDSGAGSGLVVGNSANWRGGEVSGSRSGLAVVDGDSPSHNFVINSCQQAFRLGTDGTRGGSLITIRDAKIGQLGRCVNLASFSNVFSSLKLISPLINLSGTTLTSATYYNSGYVQIANKDGNNAIQEIYQGQGYATPAKQRVTNIKKEANASLLMTLNSTNECTYEFNVLAKAGETVILKTSIMKGSTYGSSTLPSATIIGLGITPVVATLSGATPVDTWEDFTLTAINSSPDDGEFTIIFQGQSVTADARCWFSGIPMAPFISRARHYGYEFNETSPTVTINPLVVATEAVASTYTGVNINAGLKQITFSVGTADTSQKFYDYEQYWAVNNILTAVPFVRVGSTYSINDTWTIIDPYYSGTMTWSGGTIEYTTPGTKLDDIDSSTIVFGAIGTYTFDGTINNVEFVNTSGSPIDVYVNSGVTYTNIGPNITVHVIIPMATASISNLVAGSGIRIFNETTLTEMFNDIVVGTSYADMYVDGTGYTAGDTISVIVAWMSGPNAKLPVKYFTIATSSGWSILAQQTDDIVYNTNAIDGDTCTEFSADFLNVQIDVLDPDGITTPQRAYAWYISGQMTPDGRRYYHGALTADDEFNYKVNVGVVNLKAQNIGTNSVLITGGRIYRSDGTGLLVPGNGPIEMEYGRVYGLETGVSGLTPSESSKLLALPTASATASAVWDKLDSDNIVPGSIGNVILTQSKFLTLNDV